TGLTDPSKLTPSTLDSEDIAKVIATAKARAKKPEIFTIIIKPTDDSTYENFVDILDEMAITKTDHYGIGEVKPWEKTVYDQKVGNK
ncbi:MAG: biopolymer transporter ExbD, partial [Chryseobacterium sp.]